MAKKSRKKLNEQQERTEERGIGSTEATPIVESEYAGGKNPAAIVLGRLGGKKGGVARAKKLTPEQRREIAKKAAEARWKKKR
jgi:hypothetical protein